MERELSEDLTELESRWREREREWGRRLGRIRLGVEPIEDQLARYRRTTWALMIVPAIIAVMFLSLFSVFGRPDIGLSIVAIFFVPMILFAWLGYKKLERRAAAYLGERARFEDEMRRAAKARDETKTAPGPA